MSNRPRSKEAKPKLLVFERRDMSDKKLKRYKQLSLPLDAREKALLQTLALANQWKPASLARSLFYRGVASYLRDRSPEEQGRTEQELCEALIEVVEQDEEMETIFKMYNGRKKAPLKGETASAK